MIGPGASVKAGVRTVCKSGAFDKGNVGKVLFHPFSVAWRFKLAFLLVFKGL